MQGYWAINVDDRTDESFIVASRRGMAIRKGDELALVSRLHGGIVFVATAIVDAVKQAKEIAAPAAPDDVPRRYYEVIYGRLKKFDEPIPLDLLSYSLQRLTNFNRPSVHFRRAYVRLSFSDYETIRTGRIYWARTAFGTILNALPASAQSFLQIHLLSEGAINSNNEINYRRAFELLEKFLEANYFQVGKLFSAIDRELGAIRAEQGGKPPPERLFLKGDENEPADSLQGQGAYFDDLLSEFFPPNERTLLGTIKDIIERQSEIESNFEKNFRGIGWPLQKKRG